MRRILFPLIMCVTFFVEAQTNPPAFVRKVYDDLYQVMDDNHTLKPKLVLSLEPKAIAHRDAHNEDGESVVVIGQGLIELTRNFGKDSMNAMAHVLGHEMAHVFKHQNDLSLLGSGYASQEYKSKVNSINDSLKIHFERQADEFAAFYCHMAGYYTTSIGVAVLDSIYNRFQLKDKYLKKYPPLSQRKEIVLNSHDKMNALKLIFDDGLLTLLAGDYVGAEQFFKTILRYQFTSREIYNNLGVCYLMSAIKLIDTLQFPYLYPLQFDYRTKLDSELDRGVNYNIKERLESALDCFEKATNNSKDYTIGYINSATTYFLLEEYEKMFRVIDNIENSEDSVTQQAIEILKAIHLHKLGKEQEAKKSLLNISKNSEIAAINYRLISKNDSSEAVTNLVNTNSKFEEEWPIPIFDKLEFIAGNDLIKSLGDFYQSGVKLAVWKSDKFEVRRWCFKPNTMRFIDVYQNKGLVNTDLRNLGQLSSSSFQTYNLGNSQFSVQDGYIFKKNLTSIDIYRIK